MSTLDYNSRTLLFPSQKKSFAQKNEQWRKDCIDAGEGLALYNNSGIRKSYYTKKTNYNLYSDILDQSDIERTCNPLGVLGMDSPAKMQNYPISNPKIDLLVGESTKRRFDWKVRVTNDEAISAKEQDLKVQFGALLDSHLTKEIKPGEQAEQLKAFHNFSNYEYQDVRERSATHILTYLYEQQKMSYKFAKGFKDALICAEEIYQADIVGGEPVFNRLNPLNVHVVRSGESPYIEDADIILIRGYLSPGQIVDEYSDTLTSTQITTIESGFSTNSNASSGIDIGNKPDLAINVDDAIELAVLENNGDHGSPFDNNGNILVSKTYWKSIKKMLKVKFYDEDGDAQSELHDETYKIDKDKGEEATPVYASEWWEGHKIGGSTGLSADNGTSAIYTKMQPRPVQFRKMENPSKCHPGIIGTIYNTNDNVGISLMDRMKPYQYLYNILAYNVELSVSKNYGKIMRLGLHEIPEGWKIDKWMSFAQGMNIAVYDAFKEGNKGAAQGKLAGAMSPQSPVIDMEMGNTIQLYMNMMSFIKQEMGEIAGVSNARQGQIETREAVSNTEREITQSSHITEYWFSEHEYTKIRCMEVLLQTAKIAWKNKNNKKVQHVLDDGSTTMFQIDGDFMESEYGIQITNGAKSFELIENLKQLAHAGIQNQMINFSDLLDIYTTDSVASIRRKIQRSDLEKQERDAQAQKQAQEMQAQQLEAAGKAQEEMLAHEKDEWSREDARNTEDNETKLQIAGMNLSAQGNTDGDEDGINDGINSDVHSIAGLQAQVRKIDADIKIKKEQQREAVRHNKKTEEQKEKELAIKKTAANKPKPTGK
jgi:hypothetical protein|tara:strand:+ start:10339 stop:12807 length:2469 start_codon:yes stop_codon:yes gene_type:complete